MVRCLVALSVVTIAITSCGGKKNPVDPNPEPQNPTRIIQLSGDLNFGTVQIGEFLERVLQIRNTGNSTLTVTSMNATAGFTAVSAASWTSGTIGPGATQNSTIRFTPSAAQSYNGTLTVVGDQTSGTNTISFSATGVTPPPPPGGRTSFSTGTYLVGTDIAAGRYFAAPPTTGCFFERLSGLSGNISDTIANNFLSFKPPQWIVDIKSSDKAFSTDADCGTWNQSQKGGQMTNIVPGMWLVGSQVSAGLYKANVNAGCYWERLRNFSNSTLDGVIANGFISSAGQQFLEPRAGDAGVDSDDDCGTWTPTTTSAVQHLPFQMPRMQSRAEIEENWHLHQEWVRTHKR